MQSTPPGACIRRSLDLSARRLHSDVGTVLPKVQAVSALEGKPVSLPSSVALESSLPCHEQASLGACSCAALAEVVQCARCTCRAAMGGGKKSKPPAPKTKYACPHCQIPSMFQRRKVAKRVSHRVRSLALLSSRFHFRDRRRDEA